ncbi:MAG: hypothetical protein JHC95_15535 [Solirubrobacteraceae bacterium]|nr:hypothetical protein [Solirubrobacteraceae bacterium]
MSLHRSFDAGEPEPVEGAAGLHELRISQRSTQMGVGTLACPDCDAPTRPGDYPASVTTEIGCGYCGRSGPLRDFLSLSEPTRPTRVVIHVRRPDRTGASNASGSASSSRRPR